MSSVLSTSLSQTAVNTGSSSSLRFFRIRPAVDVVKKLFRKIKASPLIHRLKSEYIPFEEWKALYMAQNLEETVSSTEDGNGLSTTVFDYEFADIGKRRPADNMIRVEAPESTNTLETYQETVHQYGHDSQISVFDEFKSEDTAIGCMGNGSSPSHPPLNLSVVRVVSASQLNQESRMQVDSEYFLPNTSATVTEGETGWDSKSTIRLDEHAFGRDYDLTYD